MNRLNFHEVKDYDNLLGSRPINSSHIRLAHIRHCWSIGDPICGLHIFPFPSDQQDTVQLEYFLKSLGFEFHPQMCSYLAKVDWPQQSYPCHTRRVPENFNVSLFINSFNSAYLKLIEAQEEFSQCGISFDSPREEASFSFFIVGSTRQKHRPLISGDGHTGVPNLNKELEDDRFLYKLTSLENNSEKSWTIHYSPKQSPLSSELRGIFKFLGIQEYKQCPVYNDKPCYWRSIPFEDRTKPSVIIRGRMVPDDNTREVEMWFDSHTQHFSSGIQKLITANVEMKKSGIEFLYIDDPGTHLVNTNIEPSLGKPKTQSLTTYNYEVAISFAGTEREYARELAAILKTKGVSVFLDEFDPDKLWGKDMVEYFDSVFRNDSRYCVVFVSKDYKERTWTRHEFRSAQARALEERGNEYILPIKVDETELDGLPPTINYLPIDRGIEKIAGILIAKLQS